MFKPLSGFETADRVFESPDSGFPPCQWLKPILIVSPSPTITNF